MSKLLEESANPIHELELLPIYLAAFMWVGKFNKSQVVWYVDNESSRMEAFVEIECNSQIKSWFSRVPSYSNPADGVSRTACELPQSLGAEQTTIEWERCRFLVERGERFREAPEDAPMAGIKRNRPL